MCLRPISPPSETFGFSFSRPPSSLGSSLVKFRTAFFPGSLRRFRSQYCFLYSSHLFLSSISKLPLEGSCPSIGSGVFFQFPQHRQISLGTPSFRKSSSPSPAIFTPQTLIFFSRPFPRLLLSLHFGSRNSQKACEPLSPFLFSFPGFPPRNISLSPQPI